MGLLGKVKARRADRRRLRESAKVFGLTFGQRRKARKLQRAKSPAAYARELRRQLGGR